MKNSQSNNSTLLWFNPQLFTLKGAPLKFNLKGYSQTEFHDIVEIIEAYGGMLSPPDAPDTFIFCESDHAVGATKQDLYDIQYFHDTILALQPQELNNYKFECFGNQHIRSSFLQNSSKEDGDSDKSVLPQTLDNNHPPARSHNCSFSTKRVNEIYHHIEPFTEDENQTIIKWLKKRNFLPSKTGVKVWIQLLMENVLPHRHMTVCNLMGHFKRELSKHPEFVKYSKNLTASERVRNANLCKKSSQVYRYNEEENRVIIQYIIDNDAYRRTKDLAFWIEFLEANKASFNKARTPCGLQSYFRKRLYWELANYTDDPAALQKFKRIAPGKMMRT